MNVVDNAFVSIAYSLKIDSGEEVDRADAAEPLSFVYGKGQVLPALEKELQGKAQGESIQFSVEPEDGYGEYNEDLKMELPRKNFPSGVTIEPGMVFQGHGPHGPMNFEVIAVNDETVEGDFNHQLAGERLHFDVQVVEVREPTKEELMMAEHGCSEHHCQECHCEDE